MISKCPSSLHILPGSTIKGGGPQGKRCPVRSHTEKLGIFRKSLRDLWYHFIQALLSDFSICNNNNTLLLAQNFRLFFPLNPHIQSLGLWFSPLQGLFNDPSHFHCHLCAKYKFKELRILHLTLTYFFYLISNHSLCTHLSDRLSPHCTVSTTYSQHSCRCRCNLTATASPLRIPLLSPNYLSGL